MTMENFMNYFDFNDIDLINSLIEKIEADNEEETYKSTHHHSCSKQRRKKQRTKAAKKNRFPVGLRKEILSEKRYNKAYEVVCKESAKADADKKIIKMDLNDLNQQEQPVLDCSDDLYEEYYKYNAGAYDDDDYDDFDDDLYDDYDDFYDDDFYDDYDYDDDDYDDFDDYDDEFDDEAV